MQWELEITVMQIWNTNEAKGFYNKRFSLSVTLLWRPESKPI